MFLYVHTYIHKNTYTDVYAHTGTYIYIDIYAGICVVSCVHVMSGCLPLKLLSLIACRYILWYGMGRSLHVLFLAKLGMADMLCQCFGSGGLKEIGPHFIC